MKRHKNTMNTAFILSAIPIVHDAIISHENELESLDRAIGDGDHFVNMKRGCETISAMKNELKNLAPDAALNQIGIKLLSTIGGASGPLLASFFMAMAKAYKENPHQPNQPLLCTAAAFAAGVKAIMHRGKSDIGEKTMLDVLIPVSTAFTTLAAQNKPPYEIYHALKLEANKGVLATKDLVATKGRAAFLGERAVGHIDAGAKSCQVIIEAVCDLALRV